MVTQSVCDEKQMSNDDSQKFLRTFCREDISSDALMDLIVQYSDHKEKDNVESACLYYGITSRKLRLQNNKGIALGFY